MTLISTQAHRFAGKLELDLCSHSVIKLHDTTQMFMIVDFVREMTVKKSCKHGSFEKLLCKFFTFWDK